MKINALTLKGIAFKGEAESLNVKTLSGEITVLDHHRPLISVLTKGEITITTPDRKKTSIHARSGFLEIGNTNEVTLLID
ncbi:F0F1 ATP synthase subunit epsilon [Candidatus Jorgensenbacteria bacterium]|nr:F0F1 ATP synthase subunit epsilon [Candidatus Jorgensenbacteria bacterium]